MTDENENRGPQMGDTVTPLHSRMEVYAGFAGTGETSEEEQAISGTINVQFLQEGMDEPLAGWMEPWEARGLGLALIGAATIAEVSTGYAGLIGARSFEDLDRHADQIRDLLAPVNTAAVSPTPTKDMLRGMARGLEDFLEANGHEDAAEFLRTQRDLLQPGRTLPLGEDDEEAVGEDAAALGEQARVEQS